MIDLLDRCEHCGSDHLIDNCARCGAPQCCDTCCQITTLEFKNAALQQQIDSLQSRVHLCAGYDVLEAENAALRSENAELKVVLYPRYTDADHRLLDEAELVLKEFEKLKQEQKG